MPPLEPPPLRVIREPTQMRAYAEDQRRDGRRIALVPTMGFLHDGHLSLLRAARAQCDLLIVSIFVNPTQFAPGEDLDRYPRDEQGDLAKASDCGANVAYVPDLATMYSPSYQTYVEVRDLAAPMCGQRRPGHFSGVASIVTKLFHTTLPHVAVFGEKDFQQLAVIRRMVADLDFGIEIVGMPIVRESDGLAMSSRNKYLSENHRAQATALRSGLALARSRFDSGERDGRTLLATAEAVIKAAPDARIDYLELRDANTLSEIDVVEHPAVLATAVFFGETRLIDNVVLRENQRA